MSNAKKPSNAVEWADYLLQHTLPSPFKVGQQTLLAMQGAIMPYSQIAESLSHDPVLSFAIMEAAQPEDSSTTEYSKTLDHAISMIGVEEVERIIQKTPFESGTKQNQATELYIKSLSRALYAAELGRAIAQLKKNHNAEDLYWSCLFAYAPMWYLWHFTADAMHEARFSHYTQQRSKLEAQRAAYSCDLNQITLELISRLNLPPAVKACADPENQVKAKDWVSIAQHQKSRGQLVNVLEDKRLKMLIQQPVFLVQLCKYIADEALTDWYSRATLRSQKVLAAYLDMTRSEAISFSHQIAVDSSRRYPIPGILLPAARLFLPPIEFVPYGQRNNKNTPAKAIETDVTTETVPESVSPAESQTVMQVADLSAEKEQFAPDSVYNDCVNKLYKDPGDFKDIHAMMNAAAAALVFGLGLGRASISLVNRERTRIKTYYSCGCEDSSELAGYQAQLVKGTVFNRLVQKPASVWIKPSSEEKIKALVPMNFKQVINIENYFLMSVFVNNKPFAIVYADGHEANAPNEERYKYFKYLCKGLGMSLSYHVSRQTKNL